LHEVTLAKNFFPCLRVQPKTPGTTYNELKSRKPNSRGIERSLIEDVSVFIDIIIPPIPLPLPYNVSSRNASLHPLGEHR
jgi:hypothetical protein